MIFFDLKDIEVFVFRFNYLRLIDYVFNFKIRWGDHLLTSEDDWLDGKDFRIAYFYQSLIKILDVFNLGGLSYSIAFCSLESFLCVEIQSLFGLLENPSKQEETADNGACPALPMIAVKYSNPLWILLHERVHLFANIEQQVKVRRPMVLPEITLYVF